MADAYQCDCCGSLFPGEALMGREGRVRLEHAHGRRTVQVIITFSNLKDKDEGETETPEFCFACAKMLAGEALTMFKE